MKAEILLAAIDFGTTGVRVLITNDQGSIVASGACEVSILPAAGGHAEQSLDDFWLAMIQAWQEAIVHPGLDSRQIQGIGFSHQRCSFAFSDMHGEPLTNLVVWMDRRGIPYLESVQQKIGRIPYYDLTGLPIYYISSLSKILWFLDQAPEVTRSAGKIWPIANFIAARMGVADPPVDHATASFYGFMDTRRRKWAPSVISDLEISADLLPELVQPGTVIGRLSNREVASEMGLLPGIPLVIGGGDQQCAALGSGMIYQGQSLLNIGTASAIMAAVNEPIRDPNSIIPCVCHAAPGQWEMEGHTQASGIVIQRYRDEFAEMEKLEAYKNQGDVYDLLTHQASQSSPGAHGLMFLPMMNGSTAPRDEPYGSAALIGLNISHTKADILRSMLEGICYENRWMLETMIQSGAAMDSIFITGGASKSAFWNQLHADILKRPVVQVQTSNAALVGAAICAGIGIGLFANAGEGVEKLTRFGETFQPVPIGVEAYDILFNQFKQTYAMLCDQKIFKDLRSLVEIPVDEE